MSSRIHMFVFVAAAAGLAIGCGGAPQTAAPGPGDPAPINDVRGRYVAAYNAGDAAGVAALFAEDAVSMPDHRPALEGRAAVQQFLQETFSQFAATISITPLDTEVVGDLAHEHGTYSVTLTPKAGGTAITDNGKYLVILKRGVDGTWLIHHDIDNSSNPQPAPPTP